MMWRHNQTSWGLTVVLLAAVATPGLADPPENRTWVALDQAPVGSAAEIILDEQASSVQSTVIKLAIHGYWSTDRIGPDQETYQVIEVPGLGSRHRSGDPDLPLAVFRLAMSNNVEDVEFEGAEIIDLRHFAGNNIWPQQERLGDGQQEVPPFVRNEEIYDGQGFWPPVGGRVINPVTPMVHGIPGARCPVFPFRWNPATGQLQVVAQAVYTFSHEGPSVIRAPMPKPRAAIAGHVFDNWPEIEEDFGTDFLRLRRRFLFVCKENAEATLQPLIDQKKERGFEVTVIHLEDTGRTIEGIRDGIQDWYYAANPGPWVYDHYCLLVGNLSYIPLTWNFDYPGLDGLALRTEDLYASVDGDDLAEEIFLGRFSYFWNSRDGEWVDELQILREQVERTLAYEDNTGFGYYLNAHKVALVADENLGYEVAHRVVSALSYDSYQPTFVDLYGSEGASNGDLSAAVNDGVGLVSFRGYAEPWQIDAGSWTYWNTSYETYGFDEVDALTNEPRTPVVWSFANQGLWLDPDRPCIGEKWMWQEQDGAVAFYGASEITAKGASNLLDILMFHALYGEGLTTLSHAIQYAEEMLEDVDDYEPWLYYLLGDPDLQVRRYPNFGLDFVVNYMPSHPICFGPLCTFDVRVTDQDGEPVPGILVAAWKPEMEGDMVVGDEILDNRYTDQNGWARVPAPAQTEGFLRFSVQNDEGTIFRATADVVADVAGVDEPLLRDQDTGSLDVQASPTPFNPRVTISFSLSAPGRASVRIVDLRGRLVTTLLNGDLQAGRQEVVWDGKDTSGRGSASGVYFVVVEAGGKGSARKVVLAR